MAIAYCYQQILRLIQVNLLEIGIIPNENEINENRYACGALQLSPEVNQRILIAKGGEFQLAAIENPNQAFPGCVLVQDAVILDRSCLLGLPTFISGSISEECGACNPNEYEDDCGICDDDPTNDNACIDCAGIPNGNTEIDECGVCGGTGITDGACDCDGNTLDECGVCGGTGITDGACDCDGNILDECEVCGGTGMPDGACDCDGNILDECGVCGGTGMSDGMCDCDGNILTINITNGFSPNNDGINDFVMLSSNKNTTFKTIKIFNRWGNEVFEINDVSVIGEFRLWDGKFNNEILGVGVYVLYGLFTCENGSEQLIKENITLIK